ncbi:hypothetical protein M9H77_18198 [Catharanthus roseus]|uniref:Uncharacterized protein n=1 Tax=Catharanthus roseus TaxID=4058 RepID=A0ACC0B6R5_CATRO|nr:hypothetical protein M9H77_18198 [Catharanthus roseus]
MQSNPAELGVASPELLSRTLSVNAKVPRATVPQQKYSSQRISCCSATCVLNEHVRLDTVKVCNEPVPRGKPTSPNLLSPVRCHNTSSAQFIFILVTHHGILLDVCLASLSTQSDRGCKHGKVQIYPRLE